jgi:hypothetical protein
MSDRMPERIPEKMLGCMSDRMSLGGDHWKKVIVFGRVDIFVACVVSWQYAATIVQTTSKISRSN